METSTNVKIWKTEIYRGKKATTYYIRWRVEKQSYREPRSTRALAESFRSQLVTAASKGEAFVLTSGLPISLHREATDVTWFEFAREYADEKWDHLSGNARRNTAYSLSIATLAMLKTPRGKPDDQVLNKALAGWTFNKLQRGKRKPPEDVADALTWLATNTRKVRDLDSELDPEAIRSVLNRLTKNADGSKAAASTVARRRGVLHDALNRAADKKIFTKNPLDGVKWTAPITDDTVDKRCVANPVQARTLLLAVGEQGRTAYVAVRRTGQATRIKIKTGQRLKAFFAVMYYAGLRPEEAVNLRKHNLSLPEDGWGELNLDSSAPATTSQWVEIDGLREERQLKHRAEGGTRPVPCPPELTAILHEHLTMFGTTPDGRLFRALNEGELSPSTVYRVWRMTRAAVLAPEIARTPLAKVPYDLRHACLSTWLNAGVSPTQVAAWAGHSVAVLLRIYAHCLAGQDVVSRQRIEDALSGR